MVCSWDAPHHKEVDEARKDETDEPGIAVKIDEKGGDVERRNLRKKTWNIRKDTQNKSN